MEAVAEGDKIIISVFFFELAGQEMQRQIHNDGKNDGAGDADGQTLGIDRDRCQRARRKGNNSDDDGCLCHWLSFYFEGKFHARSRRQRVGRKNGLDRECA